MNARQERARELAGVILRVRSGAITATEGARMLARLEKELEVAEQTAEVRGILMDMRKLQEKRAFKKKKHK
jgi:AmiR/NasT family two-component response regulator